ncbi:type II toxin-antitoxin system YoeB family toxin [Maribellus maritimus]|uniref:type II toxin-antitoxin system YoeB family toxin n=1 Tax=Maribellus maritimus TaxID=2870838 RepID=UPI00293F45D7|nr:type II toxin-antitoxin system YoeB family toxin [Maribellus maritimus]MCG6188451.1 type II toxin-antitoxin system YoeB family toxin [Maribellus maritimus]
MYKIKILPQADKDIRSYHKAGNKKTIGKIRKILKELQLHPTTGISQPEQLKYELSGYWSRRIDKKNFIGWYTRRFWFLEQNYRQKIFCKRCSGEKVLCHHSI